MDAFVRFWNSTKNQVSTSYYGSSFLGHSTTEDLLKSFSEATEGLDQSSLLQISMDGPNVNKRFLREMKTKQSQENPDGPILIDIGSCGLHTVHNCYKKAVKKTEWELVQFLRCLYYLFHRSPARRDDYTRYSLSTEFPLKFCVVRWVENFSVAGRAVSILPNVRKYVQGVKLDNKETDCQSFRVVSAALDDKLLSAKLAFFQTLASDVEPFLKRFQSDSPLAPLLYEALTTLIKTVLKRFVRLEVIESASNLVYIDLKNESNLLPAKKVDLGFAVRSALRAAEGVTDLDVLRFRSKCLFALVEFCTALFANSPLAYPLTRGISCFDPSIATKKNVRSARLTKALDILTDKKWLSGFEADVAKRTYEEVCDGPIFEETMMNFLSEEHRLDDHWLKVIPASEEFSQLRKFLKMALILLHGNAFSERGFSINWEILIENLSEDSLIAQRRVYDSLSYHGGVLGVDVSKSLLHAARNSHDLYLYALKKKKEKQDAASREKAEKRQKTQKLKELESKKQKVLEEARQQALEIDAEMKHLV